MVSAPSLRAVIGIGSNLGDRLRYLQTAVCEIESFARVVRRGPIYESDPVGGPPQSDFLNTAVLVEWEGNAEQLLARAQSVEQKLERVRTERWGPRTIDLDILWIDGLVIHSASLTVPHPRLHERAFALIPLLDVEPSAVDPVSRKAYLRPPLLGIRATSLSL